MSAENTVFKAHNITVVLNKRTLIKDLTVSIKPAEIVIVVGANGAGKTTLLRALAAEIPISGGEISIHGKPIKQWNSLCLGRVRAVLPQKSTLSFPFSAHEVVAMGRSPHSRHRRKDQKIVEQVMSLTDTWQLANRRYTNLSGGEQQRVQIARVLAQVYHNKVNSNCFLLLDEPVAALDLSYQYQLFECIAELAKRTKIGVLATLHDLNLTARYADRVIMLQSGQIFVQGKVDEVLTAKHITQVYGLPVCRVKHPNNPQTPIIIPQ